MPAENHTTLYPGYALVRYLKGVILKPLLSGSSSWAS